MYICIYNMYIIICICILFFDSLLELYDKKEFMLFKIFGKRIYVIKSIW